MFKDMSVNEMIEMNGGECLPRHYSGSPKPNKTDRTLDRLTYATVRYVVNKVEQPIREFKQLYDDAGKIYK